MQHTTTTIDHTEGAGRAPTGELPTARRRAGAHVAQPASTAFEIDGSRTRVDVRTRWLGVPAHLRIDGVTGHIDVSTDLSDAVVTAAVDLRSAVGRMATRLLAGWGLDGETDVRFEADRMEPIVESFVSHDGRRPLWALVGRLTIAGVTRRIRIAVGTVRPIDDGAALAFSGTVTLRCSDFGLPRGGGLIADTVNARVAGVALRRS